MKFAIRVMAVVAGALAVVLATVAMSPSASATLLTVCNSGGQYTATCSDSSPEVSDSPEASSPASSTSPVPSTTQSSTSASASVPASTSAAPSAVPSGDVSTTPVDLPVTGASSVLAALGGVALIVLGAVFITLGVRRRRDTKFVA